MPRRRLVALAAPAFIAATTQAQVHPGCASALTPDEALAAAALQGQGAYDLRFKPRMDTTVPVTFHVIRQDNGSGGLSVARQDRVLTDLNVIYENKGLQFCQPAPTNYIDSTAFYTITTFAELDAMRATDLVPGTINIYFTETLNTEFGGLAGISAFTFSSGPQSIAMANFASGTDDWYGVVAHEVGHYFDLYHTHETALGEECPSGSNCATAGDVVCDTPADPFLNFSTGVNAACVWVETAGPRCGETNWNPSTTNIMSYSRPSCLTDITPLQTDRMVATLFNLRPELLNQCAVVGPCSPADITADGACDPGNADGAVTLSDFSCYLNEWSQGNAFADITTTGTCDATFSSGGDGVDLSDFSCYLSVWSTGCP